MSYFTTSLLGHEPHRINTVLIVGAGTGTRLSAWRQLAAQRLILVEPFDEHALKLTQRIDGMRGEEIWNEAITAAPHEQVTLHILNDARMSSTQAPDNIATYFKNVREDKSIQVPATSLAAAVTKLQLDSTGTHVLVLDAPGAAHELLQGTKPSLLQKFRWIVVRNELERMYDGDAPAAQTDTLLAKIGFTITSRQSDDIFPHTTRIAQRNDEMLAKARIATLESELASVKAERDELADAHSNDARRISELETANQALVHRQQGFDAEMVKAEAQIDLIKEVLLSQTAT